jgi:biotin operon repressor
MKIETQNSFLNDNKAKYAYRKAFLMDVKILVKARFLLVLLFCFKGNNEYCWPSEGTLGKIMGCSRDSIRKYLRILQKHGNLKIQRRGIGRSLLYAPSYLPIYAGQMSKKVVPVENQRREPAEFQRVLSINTENKERGIENV